MRCFEDLALDGQSSINWQQKHIKVYTLDQAANVVVNKKTTHLTQARVWDQRSFRPEDAHLGYEAPGQRQRAGQAVQRVSRRWAQQSIGVPSARRASASRRPWRLESPSLRPWPSFRP